MFQKAIKEKAKLRLSIAGPSGSGKTYTALSVGSQLVPNGRVAVVDTEHGSASKYADVFDFDVAEMHPPFSPSKYVQAINAAANAGYDVIILDSLSHAWNGSGGVLEIVEQASKKFRGNSYAGWQEGTPAQNALIEGIVGADIHVIGTMRSKQEYILTEVRGKQTPQKVGMAPVQRDGFEYEFDVVLDMDIENNAIIGKTRCPALQGKVYARPGAELAAILAEWLNGGPNGGNVEIDMSKIKEIDPGAYTNGNPFDDAIPTKAEVIATWNSPAAAMDWAVTCERFPDMDEAKAAFAEVVKDFGKLTSDTLPDVYSAWYDVVMDGALPTPPKLAEREPVAAGQWA